MLQVSDPLIPTSNSLIDGPSKQSRVVKEVTKTTLTLYIQRGKVPNKPLFQAPPKIPGGDWLPGLIHNKGLLDRQRLAVLVRRIECLDLPKTRKSVKLIASKTHNRLSSSPCHRDHRGLTYPQLFADR